MADDGFDIDDDDFDDAEESSTRPISPILAARLIEYLRSRPDFHFNEVYEPGEEAEALQALADDPDYFNSVIRLYKSDKWAKRLQNAAGREPVTSLSKLREVSRSVDRNLLIACGWHDQELGVAAECAYCGIPLDAYEITEDHFVPKSKGGSSELSNLIPACCDCNRLKGSLDTEAFLTSQGMSAEDVQEWFLFTRAAMAARERIGAIWQMRLSDQQKKNFGL